MEDTNKEEIDTPISNLIQALFFIIVIECMKHVWKIRKWLGQESKAFICYNVRR